MGKISQYAVYFNRTGAVDAFLDEFIRVRSGYLADNSSNKPSESADASPSDSLRHRKNTRQAANDVADSDDLITAARQMRSGKAILLDAFISLLSSYDKCVSELDMATRESLQPLSFNLAEVLKDTQVNRSVSKEVGNIDPQAPDWDGIEEMRYQRMVKDINHNFDKQSPKIAEYKPSLVVGSNIFLGVGLTFFGAYSVAGSLGVKNNFHKSIIGIACSFITLLVDTILYLIRGNV